MPRRGWLLVVGCLVLPAGAVGQELPTAPADTEITLDKATHFGGGIGWGLGVVF